MQLATMLHLGAALPNLGFAADAHYHHLTDDIIKGGKMDYRDGKIALPNGPGLGVELDRDKLAEYAELYREARRLHLRSRSRAARLVHGDAGAQLCRPEGRRGELPGDRSDSVSAKVRVPLSPQPGFFGSAS